MSDNSISDIISLAPSPAIIANTLFTHALGNSGIKFSHTVFYNPIDKSRDLYGYGCMMIGLEVEAHVNEHGDPINTGYCVAPDGSKELITRVMKTVLGHDPSDCGYPLASDLVEDSIMMWTTTNQQLLEGGSMDPDNISKTEEPFIHHRDFPGDVLVTLERIVETNPSPLEYVPFAGIERPDFSYLFEDEENND